MSRPFVLAGALAGALALGAPAHAVTILFNSGFGLENGGTPVDNYTGFANFAVNGQVDLVTSCGSTTTLCARLQPGAELIANPVVLPNQAGVLQLGAGFTNFGAVSASGVAGLVIAPTVTFPIALTTGIFGAGGGFNVTLGLLPSFLTLDPNTINAVGGFTGLASFSGETLVLAFVNNGTEAFLLESVGVSFQPFVFDGGVIPEPATWAMMIAGFGLIGLAARRRRGILARA